MINLDDTTMQHLLQKYQSENSEFVKYHIQRSVSIYFIFTTWRQLHNEFLCKKMNFNIRNQEYTTPFKFTDKIYNELVWWFDGMTDKEAYELMQIFLTNHFDVAEDNGHLSGKIASDIYFNHKNNVCTKKIFELDDCKKVTCKDWTNLLKFTRNSYYILTQLLNETTKYYNKTGRNLVNTLFGHIKKQSCMLIQYHIKTFLFKRRRIRRLIAEFIFEYSLRPPYGVLYKFYKKSFEKCVDRAL